MNTQIQKYKNTKIQKYVDTFWLIFLLCTYIMLSKQLKHSDAILFEKDIAKTSSVVI